MSECDKTGSPFKQPTVDAGGGWIRGAKDAAETNRSCVHLEPWDRRDTSLHADITLEPTQLSHSPAAAGDLSVCLPPLG